MLTLNNYKAAFWICLFLCAPTLVCAQEWVFEPTQQKAYDLVLNLQVEEAHTLIPQPQTAQEHYVIALAEAIELLLEEDPEKYSDYEERFEERLDRKTKLNTPDDLFLQAEIRMQWAFIYFKFGHEFDAALNLRQAYLTTAEIKRRFPSFLAIKKTSGLLEIIVGSVPEKYNWVLSLLNIQGDIETGLAELDNIRKSNSPLSLEADMLYALIQGFVLRQTDHGMFTIEKIIDKHPANKLALFFGSALAIKFSQGEKALSFLNRLDQQQQGLPVYYGEYLKGEVYLAKGEYLNSISSFRWFLNHYKGQNQLKDANYKIGLCYWLNGNINDAGVAFKLAKNQGKEVTEADKYAARSLAEVEMPHVKLTKARNYMDGGYFTEARTILHSIGTEDLPTLRDRIEYQYRNGRLEHKTGNVSRAKAFYEETIKLNGPATWYFAPNACLQMGYILISENDEKLAEEYFKRALSYKKHEYKNSVDTKAKSALAQIDRK